MGLDFDELRAARKPREQKVAVPLDEDLLQRIADLERRLPREQQADQRLNRIAVAPKLQQQLDELRAEAEQAAEEFTFRELPRPVYRDLIAAHPDPERKMRWHEDTFGPALIAACCVSHDFTEDQWRTLWDEWASWVVYPLFAAAFEVCEQPSRVPFGNRSSDETAGSPRNSGPAEPTE